MKCRLSSYVSAEPVWWHCIHSRVKGNSWLQQRLCSIRFQYIQRLLEITRSILAKYPYYLINCMTPRNSLLKTEL